MRQMIVYATACLLAAVVPAAGRNRATVHADAFPGWPQQMQGRTLTRLELKDYEQRFADHLPGRLAKFTDGRREYMLQWIAANTRLLHPATDCLLNAGYQITPEPLWTDPVGNLWSSALATRNDQTVRVRERIYNEHGDNWHDVSGWYWSALLRRSSGPWWVVTIVERVRIDG